MRADRSLRLLAAALVLLAVAALVGGCGKSAEDRASEKVCAARADIGKQVDQLKDMTLTSATTDQVRAGLKEIRTNLSKIRKARGDLADERRSQVKAANEQFVAAMKEITATIGRSLSLEAGAADAKQALQQLATSYKSSLGSITCS